MSTKYTIAHLSDLHLTADDGDKRTGAGGLRGMNANYRTLMSDPRLKTCDRIVVTGDVTDRGHIDAWRLFWAEVDRAGLGDKIMVVPGNHDLCCLRLIRDVPEEQSRLMAERGLSLGGQPMEFPWARADSDAGVLFLGLNSNNEGNTTITSNAIGKLGFEQLYKLGRMLHEVGGEPPVCIVLLHHSPNIPQRATSLRRGEKPLPFLERTLLKMDEDDRRQLRLLCRVFKVKAILHGHTHDALNRCVNSVRMISAPPSTEPGADGRLHYLIHTIHPDSKRLTFKGVEVKLT